MKKILLILFFLLLTQTFVSANFNDIFIANIKVDWLDKSMMEKESIISEVHDILFENPVEKQKDFKKCYKDKLKDKEHLKNYLAAAAGKKEYGDNYVSAFYYGKMKSIYMYGLQNKLDVSKIYYYDAMGTLRYVDFIDGEFPDYPYSAIQYKISGEPVGVIYYVSKDTQYLYEPDGTFKGVWYKYNLYDKHSKVILRRTFY